MGRRSKHCFFPCGCKMRPFKIHFQTFHPADGLVAYERVRMIANIYTLTELRAQMNPFRGRPNCLFPLSEAIETSVESVAVSWTAGCVKRPLPGSSASSRSPRSTLKGEKLFQRDGWISFFGDVPRLVLSVWLEHAVRSQQWGKWEIQRNAINAVRAF